MKIIESNRIEYKRELSSSLEKEVIAFLNYHDGGIIYIGIDSKTNNVIGINDCDLVQLQIKDRLRNNILPSCLGLFDVIHEVIENKDIIKITLASGFEKPYYLKKQGMSEKGCYIRVGSASEPMSTRMIEGLFSQRVRNSIGKIISPRDDLTFTQLKIYYESKKLTLNKNFLKTLELLTPNGDFNYAAYLLADENGVSIKVAKYSGTDRVDLIENNEYGYCSLIKATNLVLDKLEVENRTYTKITGRPERYQRQMIESQPLREAVLNAILHNDYTRSAPPKFEFFSDRMEITSMGGLPESVTEDDFFSGLSSPRNKELMRVFRDLDLVEHLGSGIPRILKKYDRSIFHISQNFIRVTFRYQSDFSQDFSKTLEEVSEKDGGLSGGLSGGLNSIFETIKKTPGLQARDLSIILDRPIDTIDKQIKKLIDKKLVERRGSRKTGGYWKIIE